MKKQVMLFMLMGSIVWTTACGKQQVIQQEKISPVKVMKVQSEEKEQYLAYTGTVAASEMKKLAFKSSGKIAEVLVEKGESIQPGQALITLDTGDLQYATRAAKAQMDIAVAQYNKAVNGAEEEEVRNTELNMQKAKDAYNYALEQYVKVQQLQKEGGVSQDMLDKAKLEVDLREKEWNQTKEVFNQVKRGARIEDKQALASQVEQARTDYEYKQSMLQDASLMADIGGYVVDVPYKAGEMISAGTPVVVIRNESEVVNVGISDEDLSSVTLGMEVKIKQGEKEVQGKVSNIAQVPDAQSRTYNIEITLPSDSFPLGTIVDIEFMMGKEAGVWIPISSILSTSSDYVYLVEEGKAAKRKIVLGEVRGMEVQVKGIAPKEQLVIEGMKKLKEGMKVEIQQ